MRLRNGTGAVRTRRHAYSHLVSGRSGMSTNVKYLSPRFPELVAPQTTPSLPNFLVRVGHQIAPPTAESHGHKTKCHHSPAPAAGLHLIP